MVCIFSRLSDHIKGNKGSEHTIPTMSSGAGSLKNSPARLVNPLSTNLMSKLCLSTDIKKRAMPVTCVASLTTPGQHRRSKADQWKPINPPDPNDKDYDRSNFKMRVDDKRVLRPNLSDDSNEEDDVSDYDGSGESDLTGDREEDLSEGESDSLAESRSDEETGSESDDEEDGSETESHSNDEKSDTSSGSDTDEDGDSKRRSRPLRRDCASDDDVDDIWQISDDVLKITSAIRKSSDEVLKISDSGEVNQDDDSKIQEKIKSEKEDLLIFGRIREPKHVTTTPTKGSHQFPRGTKKFNPCHIDRNIHRTNPHSQYRAGPQNKSYHATHRYVKNNRTNRQGQSNYRPFEQKDDNQRGDKLGKAPKQTTDNKTNFSKAHTPGSSSLRPFQQPATAHMNKEGNLCANQNNNKPVTYADVCRRIPPKTSPSKPCKNTSTPPTTSGKHSVSSAPETTMNNGTEQQVASHTVPSTSTTKSHSDSELEPKIIETPQNLSLSTSAVELSKATDEDLTGVPAVEEGGENVKNSVQPEIRDQDPAIVSVSTSPPYGPPFPPHETPPGCSSPVPLPSYPVQGTPLFPPQYMTYANPYAYSNYLFTVLNQLSPQDMLMIFYELKMLEAMNATLIPPPVLNTF